MNRYPIRLSLPCALVLLQLLVVGCCRETPQAPSSQSRSSEASSSENQPRPYSLLSTTSQASNNPVIVFPDPVGEFDTNTAIAIVPQDRLFTPEQVQELADAAENKRDVEAAVKLAEHYAFVRNDFLMQMRYLTIAATNGHAVSQFNLGMVYKTVPQVRDLKAARRWFEAADRSGIPEAKAQLQELKQMPVSGRRQ